ncbi:hypothetical protein KW868_13630 [Acinetobacter guillouiae]|uniref:Uncharacterized protein n=1 Tax=Acinetobacter guillouiae TaxID=106649 RepID=A0A8X8KFW9_ACIGI|nr:hypothetical protein [Acinetobacter guillouiae]MCF0265490.1 hypothetical protein [Acinetobacter guillouiae]
MQQNEIDGVGIVNQNFKSLIESMMNVGFDFGDCGPTIFTLELTTDQLNNVVDTIGFDHPYLIAKFDTTAYNLDNGKQGDPIKREYTFLQFKLVEK